MIDLILSVFRYLFLILLYVFIFQLIKMMFRDLRTAGEHVTAEPAGRRKTEKLWQEQPVLPGGPEAGLVVVTSADPGLMPGSVFPLRPGDETGLGRSGRNAITMVDPFASMDHAVIHENGGQYWLADKNSRNGTYLNEVRLDRPTVLADGDRIRIGGVTLQFVRWAYEMEPDDGSRSGEEKERG